MIVHNCSYTTRKISHRRPRQSYYYIEPECQDIESGTVTLAYFVRAAVQAIVPEGPILYAINRLSPNIAKVCRPILIL